VFDLSGPTPQNAFDALPLVGGWGRRPLELATLRLQNLIAGESPGPIEGS
jgi:hypothetical protein